MHVIDRSLALMFVTTLLATTGVRAADALRIGMIADLTGPTAIGSEINGARLAAEEINKAGGVLNRPIELVIEDSQSPEAGAVAAFGRLAVQPDLVAFLGPV